MRFLTLLLGQQTYESFVVGGIDTKRMFFLFSWAHSLATNFALLLVAECAILHFLGGLMQYLFLWSVGLTVWHMEGLHPMATVAASICRWHSPAMCIDAGEELKKPRAE